MRWQDDGIYLSVRAMNRLAEAGLYENGNPDDVAKIRDAMTEGRLRPRAFRGYGKGVHAEVCDWLARKLATARTRCEPFDDIVEGKQAFLQRCADLPPGESFTLSWAHFQRVAPIPNLTGCSVSEYGRDDIRIFKPRH